MCVWGGGGQRAGEAKCRTSLLMVSYCFAAAVSLVLHCRRSSPHAALCVLTSRSLFSHACICRGPQDGGRNVRRRTSYIAVALARVTVLATVPSPLALSSRCLRSGEERSRDTRPVGNSRMQMCWERLIKCLGFSGREKGEQPLKDAVAERHPPQERSLPTVR